MNEQTNSDDSENPDIFGLPETLEAILAELLDGARKDILVNVHVQCRV